MYNIAMIFLFALSFLGVTAQPCITKNELTEIEKLYSEGYFDQALEKSEILENCVCLFNH